MKFNEEIATAYIKHYGHLPVNARSLNRMITTIFDGRYDTEVSVKRLVYLTRSDEHDIEYIQHYAKRYDLVDYDNKIIYEFDGEHHFKFTEFYHNDYAEFINQRRADIDKQRILYRLGFDLIRVSGDLTIVELFNMLMRSNRQTGQSMFIRNSEMMIISTKDLAFDLNDVDMMSQTIINQMTEINELKRQLDDSQKRIDKLLSHKKIRQYADKLIIKSTNEENIDTIDLFIKEYINKLQLYSIVPIKVLYEGYKQWCQENNYQIEKSHTFLKTTRMYCDLNNIAFNEKRSSFASHQSRESLCQLLQIKNIKELFRKSQSSLNFEQYVNHRELVDFYKNIKSIDSNNLTDRQIQMIMMLYYDLNKQDVKQLFPHLFN